MFKNKEMKTFGFEEVEKELQEIGKSFPKATEKFLRQQAQYLKGTVRKISPSVTGLLKSSWQVSRVVQGKKRLSIKVYNNVEYAPYVNYGHRIKRGGRMVGYIKGQFFLEKSLIELEKNQEKLVSNIFNNITKGMR
ncbi:MAG: HK97 gp10 family phage protein [Cetobacterium sp.]